MKAEGDEEVCTTYFCTPFLQIKFFPRLRLFTFPTVLWACGSISMHVLILFGVCLRKFTFILR